jgi:hypothetical protein
MAERMMIGPAGWCWVVLGDPGVGVVVRFAQTVTGRLTAVEVVLARSLGVTADSMREVPIGPIESWANGRGRDRLLAKIASRSTLTDAEVAEVDHQWRAVASEAVAAQEAALTEETALGVAERYAAGLVSIGEGGVVFEPLRSRVRNLRLRVPSSQPVPDSFYREVARLFSEVAIDTARPAEVLAEANEVPVSRVHGWVKEARRRGLLAPGERQSRRQ